MAMTRLGALFRAPFAWLAVAACFSAAVAVAQQPTEADLKRELQQGGLVLVISDAQARPEVPEERERATSNFNGEPELDETGQGEMLVISYAFRTLQMHVDQSLSAPTFRSRQSAVYLGFGELVVVPELADVAWLTRRVMQAPPPGRSTVVVTDASLIAKAFGRDAGDLGAAETLIYRPRENGADFVARLTTADWAKLATN